MKSLLHNIIFHRKVVSHYPAHLSKSLIRDLDRFFLPVDGVESHSDAHILWTFTDGRMRGIFIHFVALLPMKFFPTRGKGTTGTEEDMDNWKAEEERNMDNNTTEAAEVGTNDDEKRDMSGSNAERDESDVHADNAEREEMC